MSRRYVRVGALGAAIAIAAAVAVLALGQDDAGDSLGLRVSGIDATVSTVSSRPDELAPVARAVGRTYRVSGANPQRRWIQLRFRVPRRFRLAPDETLMVATRPDRSSMWVLLEGRLTGRGFTIRTQELSEWSLVSVKERFARAGKRARQAFDELRGRQPEPPDCPPLLDYHVDVDVPDGDDPLLFACAEQVGGHPAIAVYSNRALALEFQPPKDASVRVAGGSLSEEVWSRINSGIAHLGSGSGAHLLPGGGHARIVSDHLLDASEGLRFRPTNQALATDVLVLAATRGTSGRIRSSAQLAGFASCVYEAAGALGDERLSTADWVSLWGECGSLLSGTSLAVAGAVVAGAVRTGQALVDQLDLFAKATVRLERSPVRLLPLPGPAPGSLVVAYGADGFPSLIGPFNVAAGARTLGDAVAAFGEPDSMTPVRYLESGCKTVWPSLGLAAFSGSFGAGAVPCGLDVTLVQTLVIDGPAFETDRGLRVGDSLAELLSSYPAATTRGLDAEIGDQSISGGGDLYTLETPHIPFHDFVTTLQALVRDGRVRTIEVTPFLAGD
jgi:hypothetical protein